MTPTEGRYGRSAVWQGRRHERLGFLGAPFVLLAQHDRAREPHDGCDNDSHADPARAEVAKIATCDDQREPDVYQKRGRARHDRS